MRLVGLGSGVIGGFKVGPSARQPVAVGSPVTAAKSDLHREGRYDRMSDDLLKLTGQGPLSVQEFVGKNAAAFTASAKEAI